MRLCRELAHQHGWVVAEVYVDHALSGASTLRPGYQRLLEDVRTGRFVVAIAEALDRLSRDQEHTASLFKQLAFAGVRLVTVAEGEIGELHVGLKGTMNALFLRDLAQKLIAACAVASRARPLRWRPLLWLRVGRRRPGP